MTDAAGKTVVQTLWQTLSASSTSASSSDTSDSSGGDSISTPAIIGISVAVGVVVLALVLCAVWRMKRRNSDEDEVIRWSVHVAVVWLRVDLQARVEQTRRFGRSSCSSRQRDRQARYRDESSRMSAEMHPGDRG